MIKLTENVNSDYFQLFKYAPFNQLRLSDYKLTNDRRIIDQPESRLLDSDFRLRDFGLN